NAIPMYCSRGASMRFTVGGQTSSFVVLSPQLSTQYGYWPPYYVKEMIKYAKANLQIDPDRIYITGLSLGGGGTWRVATDSENWDYSFDAGIAAIAPVCGTQEMNDANYCATIGANHLPVWAFHSMDDGTVGVGATQHGEILSNTCGVTPAIKLTYYQSGGHYGAWANAYDTGHITRTVNGGGNFTANPNLYEWFLSNKRSTSTSLAPNYTAPVATAGAAQVITLPISAITLTGSGSGTGGASISSYSWAKTSGPAGGTISLPLLNTTLVTGLVQGTYVFTLTVTDNHGLTATSNVSITVNPLVAAVANQTPSANAGANTSITLPTSSVTLTGAGSKDPDGSIASYWWTQTVGPAGAAMSNRSGVTNTITGLTAGSYTYILEVTDNGGLKAYSAVIITVNGSSAAPVAPVVNQLPQADAGSNITITLPTSSATLTGAASKDPDGSITGYWWTQTVGPAGVVMGNRSGITNTISGLTAGSFVFILEVTDNGGLKAYSAVTITVAGAATAPPVTPPATGNLLGYIKMSTGPYQACDDASSTGRTAVYGSGIANGNILYLNSALTQKFDGGWNWYSFTPVLGSKTTYAFAVYPTGGILLLRNCATGGSARIAEGSVAVATTTAEQDIATLKAMKDASTSAITADIAAETKMSIYPNPVRTNATITLTSADNSLKTISLYNSNGVLKAKYNWQTTKGNNVYSLSNVAGLANGLYVAEIRDNNGKSIGSLKFIKM
ncbi:MAG: T9SS type A sorting domain-containing protein, partial [Chitinophagaceae bacterium]